MAVIHQTFLNSKLYIQLDVRYHVHIDVLIYRPISPFSHIIGCNTVKFIKRHTEIWYLFYNWLGPKASTWLLVNIICLFYCIGDLYSKLMWCLTILWFYLGNNHISTVQSLLNSQYEDRLITYLIHYGILSQLNWFGLFKVL